MGHFYGDIQGNRGEASRMGSRDSGFRWHCRGWNVGSGGYLSHVEGQDICQVNATAGSSGYRTVPLATIRQATEAEAQAIEDTGASPRERLTVTLSEGLTIALAEKLAPQLSHGFSDPADFLTYLRDILSQGVTL